MSAQDNLRAEQFVNRVKQTGGATMNLRTGKLVNPGKRGYMVGGEPDSRGQRIPTHTIPSADFEAKHVEEAAALLRDATGNRSRVHLGAWQDAGNVEIDASSRTKKPNEAIRKGRNRGEKAIWDNKNMREIDTGGRG